MKKARSRTPSLRDLPTRDASTTFIGADGETPSNAAAIPILTIERWDGAELAAPTVSIDGTDDGVYEATLAAATELDIIDNLTSIRTARAAHKRPSRCCSMSCTR
jgi:hypothetical protein